MPSPFACATLYLEINGGSVRPDAPAMAIDESMHALILRAGLTLVADASSADVQIRISSGHALSPSGPAAHPGADLPSFSAMIQGAGESRPVTATLASGASGARRIRHGRGHGPRDQFVEEELAPALDAYLAEHSAGARLQVSPADARVRVGVRAPVVAPVEGLWIRGFRHGDPIEIRIDREGYATTAMTLVAVVSDQPAVVTLSRLTTPLDGATSASTTPISATTAGVDSATARPKLDATTPDRARPDATTSLAATPDPKVVVTEPEPMKPARIVTTSSPMERIKVVFFSASPRDAAPLALDEETREIRAHLLEGTYRDRIEFIPYTATRFDDVMVALNLHTPDIVHFSGHGSADGALLLQDRQGVAAPLDPGTARQLLASFATPQDRLRVVLFNACFSIAQAEALNDIIDVTIASTRALPDAAAIAFSGAFYRAIAFGRSVKNAFDQGLSGVRGNLGAALDPEPTGSFGDAVTSAIQLVTRPGVDASALILISPRASAPSTPSNG